jgi:hypothetical protein
MHKLTKHKQIKQLNQPYHPQTHAPKIKLIPHTQIPAVLIKAAPIPASDPQINLKISTHPHPFHPLAQLKLIHHEQDCLAELDGGEVGEE